MFWVQGPLYLSVLKSTSDAGEIPRRIQTTFRTRRKSQNHNTLHVSDGLSVHHQEFKTLHTPYNRNMSNRYCCLLASKQTTVTVGHIPVVVGACTVLNSWWWTERPSETCRMLFQNKINLRNWCTWLVLLWKHITMDGPMNVQLTLNHFMIQHRYSITREYSRWKEYKPNTLQTEYKIATNMYLEQLSCSFKATAL